MAGGPLVLRLGDARHTMLLAGRGTDLLRGAVEFLLARLRATVAAQVLGTQASQLDVGLAFDALNLVLELLGRLHKGVEVHDFASE